MRTPKVKNEMISEKRPEFEVGVSLSDIAKNSAFEQSVPAKKSDPFQTEQDHLVEEVRKRFLLHILKYLAFPKCYLDLK
jgi:hypothetical protein